MKTNNSELNSRSLNGEPGRELEYTRICAPIRVNPYHYSEKSLFLAKIYRSQSTIHHSLFTIHFGCGSAALGSPVVDDSLYCLETAKENCLVTQLVVCYLSQPMCTELSRLTPQSPLEYPR